MWQAHYERYQDLGFTVVGLALDVEGVGPAKRYYEKYGVTFPALVDPNYATGFGAVPKTFFINELGVVQETRGWQDLLPNADPLQPVNPRIREQWTAAGKRLDPASIGMLARRHRAAPSDLSVAVELASRYLDLQLFAEAREVVARAVSQYRARGVARSGDSRQAKLLGQAYLQLARASVDDREAQIKHATVSFYLHPTVGFGKQIARIIAPEKFDNRPGGGFDNDFREGTLRRLRKERRNWLDR